MASDKFARCFPTGDGYIVCQWPNGSYIVFPAYDRESNKKSPSDKESDQLDNEVD